MDGVADARGRQLDDAGLSDTAPSSDTVPLSDTVLLNALLDTTGVGIAFLDRDLRSLRVNEPLTAINGLPAEAHLGHTPMELLPDVPQSEYVPVLERVLAGERVSGVELRGSTP